MHTSTLRLMHPLLDYRKFIDYLVIYSLPKQYLSPNHLLITTSCIDYLIIYLFFINIRY